MKDYIAPRLVFVDLRTEEGIAANNVTCYIGECHLPNGKPVWEKPSSSIS